MHLVSIYQNMFPLGLIFQVSEILKLSENWEFGNSNIHFWLFLLNAFFPEKCLYTALRKILTLIIASIPICFAHSQLLKLNCLSSWIHKHFNFSGLLYRAYQCLTVFWSSDILNDSQVSGSSKKCWSSSK